jgi:putative ABC transport system permease protein
MQPARGRGFTAAEHSEASTGVVLISDRYWRVRMSANPNVLEASIRIGQNAYRIVGVMPASFRFPDKNVDVWFPVALDNKYAQARQNTWYRGIGRLKAGVSLEQARANLAAVQAHLGEQYPDTDRELHVEVMPLKETTVSDIRGSLWLLFGGVSVLLLITCTNIAGLLLSRAIHRHQEISIRLSLGASRARIAMQLLVETFLLAAAGAGVGLASAVATVAAIRWAATDLPRMDEITIDWMVVLYTFATAMVVTLLCGTLPAIRISRDDVASALKEGGRTQVAGRHAVQWLLIGAQVALSVTLLAAAGLLLRSFQELSRVALGFDASRVLTFRVSGSFAETVNYDRLIARVDNTIDALRTLPGVEAVATSTFVPGVPTEYERAFALSEASNDASRLIAEYRIVSAEYFATMKIPLMAGEMCRRQPFSAARVMLVNRAFVARYLGGWPTAIGLHLSSAAVNRPPERIVGVIADAREQGLDRAPVPTVYSCFSAPNPAPVFLVRTAGEPLDLAQTVRVAMKEREPLRSVYDIAPLEDRIGDAFAQNRLRTIVLTIFALSALCLTCVGLYGTLNYVVNLRRREVGLRLALGAARSGIIRQFVVHSLRIIAISSGCGLVLALAFTRLLRGMLYGVSTTDPLVLSTVVAVVLAVATVAALIPAARASLIEPMRVLREG